MKGYRVDCDFVALAFETCIGVLICRSTSALPMCSQLINPVKTQSTLKHKRIVADLDDKWPNLCPLTMEPSVVFSGTCGRLCSLGWSRPCLIFLFVGH